MSSVQSIRRAFDVLGALAGGPLGVTDVADRTGLPKSTAARMLLTLAREGAVELRVVRDLNQKELLQRAGHSIGGDFRRAKSKREEMSVIVRRSRRQEARSIP